MKAYNYKPEDIGIDAWPSGTFGLDGIESTDDPTQADVFMVPGNLRLFSDSAAMERLPYFIGNEKRHVFADISEDVTAYHRDAILFRCNLKTWMHQNDPNSISWPWPVENFAECVDLPEGGFTHDISFHGWLYSPARFESTDSCQQNGNLKCDFALYNDFTGRIYHESEGIRRRAEFRNSMRRSRLALCPENIPGDFPYRFFEAMSAARVPILVGSDYILPFEDEIPYKDFIIQVSRADARFTGQVAREFLDKHSDEDLVRIGKVARLYWLKYLNRDDWKKMMAYAVRKKFREFGFCESA